MKKFKVSYSGFYYVEANDLLEVYDMDKTDSVYEEEEIDTVEEIDDFLVEGF